MEGLAQALPPKSTVYDYLESGTGTARWSAFITNSRRGARAAGPGAVLTAAIIDLQTAKGAQNRVFARSFGLRRGQEDQRSKAAHPADTLGLLLNVVVNSADVQDRDGAFHLLRRARRLFLFIERIFADGGYAGRKMALTVRRTGAWSLQIVKRSDVAGFDAAQTVDCRKDVCLDQSQSPPGPRLCATPQPSLRTFASP